MASASICLLDHNVLLLASMHEQQQEGRSEEKYSIHNAKRKARLEHCTCFVDAGSKGRVTAEPIRSERDAKIVVDSKVGAIGRGNTTEFIDTRYERSDEAKIDESDEVCGVPG